MCLMRMYYHSGISSCYETLALSGLRFVDKKLSLTTMVSFNLLQYYVYYHSGISSC